MYVKYDRHINAHIRAFPKEANKSIDYNVDISILHALGSICVRRDDI